MTSIEDPNLLEEPVTYLCKYKRHTCTLKPSRKIIIDGNIVHEPGVTLRFTDGRCTVRDKKIVELMEHAFKYYGIGKLIKRAPTHAEYKRAADASKKVEEAKQAALKKYGDPSPKEPTSFAKMLEKKKDQNTVTGMRSVNT